MNDFANDVNSCVSSFANQTQTLGFRIRNDVARPLLDSSVNLGEETHQIYSKYVGSRGKCAQARKDAVKMRQKYVGCVREANGAIQALRRAKSSSSRRRKKSSDSVDSNCTPRKVTPSSPQRGEDGELAWEDALRGYGGRYGLTKNCDSVIRALEEVQAAEAQYTAMVKVENAAVADSQTMELKTLDAVQKLEEVRIKDEQRT